MNVAVGGTGYFPDDVSFFTIFIILMKIIFNLDNLFGLSTREL